MPCQEKGEEHLQFIEYVMLDLKNKPLQQKVQMWFMHDGAPPHFQMRKVLNNKFHIGLDPVG